MQESQRTLSRTGRRTNRLGALIPNTTTHKPYVPPTTAPLSLLERSRKLRSKKHRGAAIDKAFHTRREKLSPRYRARTAPAGTVCRCFLSAIGLGCVSHGVGGFRASTAPWPGYWACGTTVPSQSLRPHQGLRVHRHLHTQPSSTQSLPSRPPWRCKPCLRRRCCTCLGSGLWHGATDVVVSILYVWHRRVTQSFRESPTPKAASELARKESRKLIAVPKCLSPGSRPRLGGLDIPPIGPEPMRKRHLLFSPIVNQSGRFSASPSYARFAEL